MGKRKTLVVTVLAVVCAVFVSLAFSACKKNRDDNVYGLGEEGYYYYDGATTRYMLSLESGEYLISANDFAVYSGKYTCDEKTGEIVFFCEDGDFSATFGESALSLTLGESGYSFKLYVNFTVTFLGADGEVYATEEVLNGQHATNLAAEDTYDYYFIGWYETADYGKEFSFNTSIAGDTVVYGWFLPVNHEIKEKAVTLSFGGGVTEKRTTRNGALWSLPSEYEGRDILGWWVSDTDTEGELTFRYTPGDGFESDTTLFAVYDGDGVIGASITAEGVTWENAVGANVSVAVYDADGEVAFSGSTVSSAAGYSPSALSSLDTGKYTVEVTSGNVTETLTYVVNGLARVSMSSTEITFSGEGRVMQFSPVENAEGYEITVTNGGRTVTRDLGEKTYYNFTDWEMTPEGITFTVRAYADGFVDSVSDGYTLLLVLDTVKINISGDVVSWTAAENAEWYEVTVTEADGFTETFKTSDTSLPLKYYDVGTYDVCVRPVASGYYSETSVCPGYSKTSLAAPRIIDVTSYSITWNAVKGATSYEIKIGDNTYTTDATTFYFTDVSADTAYEIYLKACGESGAESPYSDAAMVTDRDFAPAVTYEKNTVFWNYDLAAAWYVVSVNDGVGGYTVTEGNSVNIELTKSGENKIAVTAYDAAGTGIGYAETSVTAYSVTLDGNGAITEKTGVFVAYGDTLELGAASLGHTDFLGWYTMPDLTGGMSDEYGGEGYEIRDGSVFTFTRDIYLYAYWSYEYVDVALDAGKGALSGEGSVVRIKYGSGTFALPVPECDDPAYVFSGWYTEGDGGGVKYTTGTGASCGTSFAGEDALYAYFVRALSYERTRYNGEVAYSVSATTEAAAVEEITIPADYDGYGIVLNSGAFSTCAALTVLNIPDTVLYVSVSGDGYRTGSGAFAGCAALREVNVYATEEPGERTYYSEDGVLFRKTAGSEDAEILYYPVARESGAYEIPSVVYSTYERDILGETAGHSVTTVPTQVFRDRKITEVTIPATVTEIASQAFYDNTSLVSVYFEPGSSETLVIADRAFSGCTALLEVTLPARADFNAVAFSDCSSLLNVYVESGGSYSSDGGILTDALGTTIVYFPAGRGGDVVIAGLTGGNITAIGEKAFASNRKITSVTISATVTEIGESAFEGCTGIEYVEFSGNANSSGLTIRARAFYGCQLISEIYLPANLVKMEADAFGNCGNLKYIYFDSYPGASLDFAAGSFGTTNYIVTLEFGPGVPLMDFGSVFDGGRLAEVIVDPGNNDYYSDEYGAVYNHAGTEILYYPLGREGEYTLLSTATSVPSGIFTNRVNLTCIKIGAGVEYIDDYAFEGCSFLTGIEVDEANPYYYTADGVLYLKSGGVPYWLVTCPRQNAATTVTVPGTVMYVSSYAFDHNATVVEIVFETPEYSGAMNVGSYSFSYMEAAEMVILPEGMTSIPSFAFYDSESLVTVKIPSTVTAINARAFYKCYSLRGDLSGDEVGIKLPEGLETIGGFAFCNCNKLAVTIPSTVTSIGMNAFQYCWDDSESSAPVVFADGDLPLYIDEYAFSHARYATAVEIPARVTHLGESTFGYLGYSLDGMYAEVTFADGCGLTALSASVFQYSRITEVVIPETVTDIYERAFYMCSSLATVKFAPEGKASSLKTIGQYAFRGTILSDVTIPKSVTSIADSAFYSTSEHLQGGLYFEEGSLLASIGPYAFYNGCMTEAEIPAGVTSIDYGAFQGCASLKKVTFAGSGLGTIPYHCFEDCVSLEVIKLPDGLTVISDISRSSGGAFQGCTALETIEIPYTVTFIGPQAFKGCTSLSAVTFETASGSCMLEAIGAGAFQGCVSLTEFSFPVSTAESISLGDGLFEDSGVRSVTLSGSVTDVGPALRGADLDEISVAEDNGAYTVGSEGKILYGNDEKAIVRIFGSLSGDVVISGVAVAIGAYAFFGQSGITSIVIPSGVTSVGDYAFSECVSLEKVIFEDGGCGCELGTHVFEGCSKLADVTLLSGTTELPDYVFSGCDLSETKFPDTIAVIGSYALKDTKITSLSLPSLSVINAYAFYGSALKIMEYGAFLTEISTYAFSGASSLEEFSWPSAISVIGGYTFQNCSSLKEIYLPSTLTNIEQYAFSGCASLENIELPSSLTYVGGSAFRDCVSLEGIALPDSVGSISTYVFYGCSSLGSAELPGGITEIGNYAFSHCTSLTGITLPGSVTKIGFGAFSYSGLVSIELGDGVTSVDNQAFYGCTELEYIVIGRNVTSLGTSLFYGCTSLTYAYTGDLVTSVTDRMFYECMSLTTVEFGPSVKTIAQYAFYGCTSLTEIELSGTLDTIAKYAFCGCTAMKNIVIPSSVSSVAEYAFGSCACDIFVENTSNYVATFWDEAWLGEDATATVYYYTQSEPASDSDGAGNLWHYDDEGNAAIW